MSAESLLPAICELFAKSVVILLFAALVVRLWRGATAAQRHFVWLAAIVTLVLLPATRFFTPRWIIPLHREVITQPATLLGSPAPIVTSEMTPPAFPATPGPVPRHLPDWRKLLIATWLGGGALLIGYRLLGMRRLHGLKRRSALLLDARIGELAAAVLCELKIGRRVEIRISEECHVPMTWGGLHPVLLLPAEAVSWSAPELRAALRHEAGHILHRDYLVRWLASLAGAIYWPNPLIWLAIRSLRIAQEQATDDLVLRAGTPADEYATQLFEAARIVGLRGSFTRHAVAMANPSTLESRVVAILDQHRARRPLSRRTATFGSFIIATTLALCEAAQLPGAEQPSATSQEGAGVSGAAETKSDAAPQPASPTVLTNIPTDPTMELPPTRVEKIDDENSADHFILHVPVKLRPGKKVNVPDLVIQVLVYDFVDGRNVLQTTAKVSSRWMSPPADWSKGDTEELAVEYQLPKPEGAMRPRKFCGYIVRVYYQGLLQASDASSPQLKQQYPPPARLPASDTMETHETAGDVFVSAYKVMMEGEKLEKENHLDEARDLMQTAARLLTEIVRNHPEWQPQIMEFRQTRVKQAIQRLTTAIDAQGKVDVGPMPLPVDGTVQEKAMSIILDKIEMRDVKIAQAVKLLHDKSVESDPDKRGVNIILQPDVPTDATITLSLRQIPVIEAAKYIAGLVNLSPFYNKEGIVIGMPAPLGPTEPEAAGPLITREWKLAAGIVRVLTGTGQADPGSIEAWLFSHGVKFGVGASALYIVPSNRLIVRNTQDQLNLVDQLVAQANSNPPPIKTPAAPSATSVPAPENLLLARAAAIIIPKVELREVSVAEAVDVLRQKSIEADPEKHGIKITLQPGTVSDAKLTLSLTNIPLIEALHYVTQLSNLKMVTQADGFMIQPPGGGHSEPAK